MKDRLNKAWEFEIILNESKTEIKSWFYSDTEEDARNRIENYMNAKIISLKEIPKPELYYADNKKNKVIKENKV
jgi:hypothetical protein